jgi:hypothetical protein
LGAVEEQFGRFACGFAPACGSEVGICDAVVYGTAEAMPLRGFVLRQD